MKPSAVALPPRSALPQDLTVQPSRQLEQLAATRSYQNYPYMSIINSNPQFSGNTAYNQSSADMMYSLPQSRNQLLADRLPPASVAFVSGNLGFSSDNRETLMPGPLGDLMPSSDPDEILPYYTGGRNISSDQQVMKPSAVALPPRSALPQDLTVQPSRQLEQLAASRSYQNHLYMSIINSHPEFSGSTAYNQSSADMIYSLPQSRNQLLSNRLPPASVAFVSGNLGFSSDYRETFMPSPLGDLMPSTSSDPDEILPYYSGGRNLRSNQQRGSFSTWDCEAQSRSLSLPQGTHHNLLGEPSWVTSQRIPRAYSDLYQSQPGVAPEFQEQHNVQDLSSKQSHRFWWHKK